MPRTLSVEEYKELGKRYYNRKDYPRALSAFTDGIDASVGRDIQLYDYRAAVHDKLDNATAALSDARYMIKTYEKDPRGYLRAGQLLLKMDKKQQALQIYARGLRYVPASNMQLNLLRGAHDKLNRELCPPRAVDPFTQLPQEIVEMVMSYLRFSELVSCLRVSKQWNLFLSSLPNLWTSMDLLRAGTKRSVKPSFVKTCMRMAQNKITYARIANFGHRGILQSLITNCSSLEKLEFVLSPLGPDSILEAVVPARSLKMLTVHADIELPGDTMRQILKHRPTLEELRVYNVGPGCSMAKKYDFELSNLRVLDLRSVHPNFMSRLHFLSILQHALNLREFVFEETSQSPVVNFGGIFERLTKLEVLRIRSQSLLGYPRASICLRELDYDCPQRQTTAIPWTTMGYPNLETLRARDMLGSMMDLLDPSFGNEGKELPEQPTMLKSMTIVSIDEAQSTGLEEVLGHARLQELEELSLEGLAAGGIDDATIKWIVQLKHLRRLHLDSALITGVGIKLLVTTLKGTLKYLTLTACSSIGRDAVDWAARQGVAVTVNEAGVKNKSSRRR